MENKLKMLEKDYDFYLQCAINICRGNKNNAYELLHECIIYVNDIYNTNKINKSIENGTFKFLFIFAMQNEYKSKTSYYYRKINKFEKNKCGCESFAQIYNIKEIDNDKYDLYYYELVEKINDILKLMEEKKEIKWWEGQVYKLYYMSADKLTYRGIEKMKGINRSAVYNAVVKVNNAIQPYIEKLNNEYKYL